MNDIDDEVKLGCSRVCLSGRLLETQCNKEVYAQGEIGFGAALGLQSQKR